MEVAVRQPGSDTGLADGSTGLEPRRWSRLEMQMFGGVGSQMVIKVTEMD